MHFELEKNESGDDKFNFVVIFVAHIQSQIYKASLDIFFSFAGGLGPSGPLWLRQWFVINMINIRVHIVNERVYLFTVHLARNYANTVRFSDTFLQTVGIFNPNFTRLLHVPIDAILQIYIQLSPTVTKLCYFKCDHPACVSADGGHFEHMI